MEIAIAIVGGFALILPFIDLVDMKNSRALVVLLLVIALFVLALVK